jgi:hypothetical protein
MKAHTAGTTLATIRKPTNCSSVGGNDTIDAMISKNSSGNNKMIPKYVSHLPNLR